MIKNIIFAVITMSLGAWAMHERHKHLSLEYVAEWADRDHYGFIDYLGKRHNISSDEILDAWIDYSRSHPVPADINYTRTFDQ